MIKPALQDEAFIADVKAAADATSMGVRLWWLGQSGFLLQYGLRHVLFDPYLSDSLTRKYEGTEKPHVRLSERVVDPWKLQFIDVVTASHGHTDHLDPETLCAFITFENLVHPRSITQLVGQRMGIMVSEPMKVDSVCDLNGFRFHAVPAVHDPPDRDDAGDYRHLGYVVRCGVGMTTLYHSGDTLVYPGMVETLRPHHIDIAILPINGKVGNMNGLDAAHLAKDIGAKIVIPCHYDMFEFNTANPYEQFVPECEKIRQAYRVLKLGERFTYPENAS